MLVEESPAEVVSEPPRASQRRRPNLLVEAVLVTGAYLGYSAVRNARATRSATRRKTMVRLLSRFILAAWLCLAGVVGAYGLSYAQSDGSDMPSAPQEEQPADQPAPRGPLSPTSPCGP